MANAQPVYRRIYRGAMIIPWTQVEVRGFGQADILGSILGAIGLRELLGGIVGIWQTVAMLAEEPAWRLASDPCIVDEACVAQDAASDAGAGPDAGDRLLDSWTIESNDQRMLDLLGWASVGNRDVPQIEIAKPRGLPSDVSKATEGAFKRCRESMGDPHCESWLLVDEVDLDQCPHLAWRDPKNEPHSLPDFQRWIRRIRSYQRARSLPDSHARIVFWLQ